MPDCAKCNKALGHARKRCRSCGACEECCSCSTEDLASDHFFTNAELGLDPESEFELEDAELRADRRRRNR